MNKKIKLLIILATLWVILTYGIFWLPDEYMLLIGLIFIFIPITFIIILVCSLIYTLNNSDISGIIPITILCTIFILFISFFPTDIKREYKYESQTIDRQEIIELIKDGKLKEYSDNHILLPGEYKHLSESPYLYVPINYENELLVGFLFEAGFPDEDLWLIYSTGGEELIKENIDQSLYNNITKKDNNWYLVQFN